jgi:hypothetical protein
MKNKPIITSCSLRITGKSAAQLPVKFVTRLVIRPGL